MISKVFHAWLQIKASGLQQDAVIEIMLAILGAMLGILALISAIIAGFVGVIGFLGFQTVKDEAKRRAEEVAKDVAAKIARATFPEIWAQSQAAGLSEGQGEIKEPSPEFNPSAVPKLSVGPRRRKATSDKALKDGGTS